MKNKHKGFSTVELLFILIVVGLIGSLGWYVWNNRAKKESLTQNTANSTNKTESKKNTITDGPGTDWQTYTNNTLKFSVQVPKTISSGNGAQCTKESWVYDNYGNKVAGQSSYRLATGVVPVTVVEDGDNIYITESYSYQLTGETRDSTGHSYFSGCEKIDSTPSLLRQYATNDKSKYPVLALSAIPITVVKAKNQGEILKQVHKILNDTSLKIASMTKDSNGDWQNINFDCSPEEGCMRLNYKFYLRYYTDKKKVVCIKLGQAAILTDAADNIYDSKVVDSFKLL